AIAPFDFTGLASPPERIVRHLLAAHHDGEQALYDLELLALHPGALERLRARVDAVVRSDGPRARWLRELTVYEGYHEDLLALVDAVIADPGLLEKHAGAPDLSLRGTLRWCAQQPTSARAALRAWRAGSLRFVDQSTA
ncbi:MAG: hypothetical protein JST92_19645, partial [Deltaproteobacteria bacterium]|nr:hypothetical protein [Deltaproteobacteria bacterium]